VQPRTRCRHGLLFSDPTSVHNPTHAAAGTCACTVCHRATCRDAKTWWKNQPIEMAPSLIPGTTVHMVRNPDTGKPERYDAGPRGIEAPARFHTQCLACGVAFGDQTMAGMVKKKTEHFTLACPRKDRRFGFKDLGAPSPWTMPKDPGLPKIEGWTLRPLPPDVDPDGFRAEIYHDVCGYNAKVLRPAVGQKTADHMRDRHGA